MSDTDFTQLAADWYAAWNAHDLDGILAHYADDVVFTSPFVARLGAGDGTLAGREALRDYFQTALDRFPDLHFEPIALGAGVGSAVLHYRSVQGLLAFEVMTVGPDGKVTHVLAHYAESSGE